MRSSHTLDRLHTRFDDDRLVTDAGLLLPATLAQHLGLNGLVEEHLDLGQAAGRANTGDKLLTLVMSPWRAATRSMDANGLRAGGTGRVLGFRLKAASTLGTFLRSFGWGHVRQLDRVSRALLARAWAAGAGPGAEPLTIDLDSTICETYGLQMEGARHHGYTGVRATTLCWRWRPARATCSWRVCARAAPTPSAALPTSWPRRSAGYNDRHPHLAFKGGPPPLRRLAQLMAAA